MHVSPARLGLCAALSVLFFWSGWLVISRWGVTSTLSNSDILLLRFGTATFFTLPFALWGRSISQLKALFNHRTIIAGLACGVPYVWLCFIGLEISVAANAGVVINGSIPIFTLLIMWGLTRQSPALAQFPGIFLILAGNVVVLAGDPASSWLSYILLLGAGCLLSFYSSLTKIWEVPAKDLILVAPTTNLIVILPLWYLAPSQILQAPWSEILIQAGYQGILVSILVLWLMSFSLKHISSYSFAFIMALVPLFAAFLAHFTLGEPLTAYILGGAALCTVGIIVLNIPQLLRRFKTV